MSSFVELMAQIKQCTQCEAFLPEHPRPILQADPAARILIAGQAPGLKTHQKGRAFDDASGRRLRNWLGVTETRFYDPQQFAILPMGFCYPGRGQSGDAPPRTECAPAWREAVLNHLNSIELTLILGQHALRYHLPAYRRVGDALADWQKLWPTMLVLPHPSPRNQYWFKQHAWFEQEVIPQLQARVDELVRMG